MYFKQFYLGCLAHASYLIGSDGEAAVVDPQRDVDIYLEEAQHQGLKIRHVIETHLHADFVTGHRELAGHTGAKVYFGAQAGVRFEHVQVHEGDEVRMGDVVLHFLETPGHTPESICILVFDMAKSREPERIQAHLERGRRHERLDRREIRNLHIAVTRITGVTGIGDQGPGISVMND